MTLGTWIVDHGDAVGLTECEMHEAMTIAESIGEVALTMALMAQRRGTVNNVREVARLGLAIRLKAMAEADRIT